jgi:hypothetical protein
VRCTSGRAFPEQYHWQSPRSPSPAMHCAAVRIATDSVLSKQSHWALQRNPAFLGFSFVYLFFWSELRGSCTLLGLSLARKYHLRELFATLDSESRGLAQRPTITLPCAFRIAEINPLVLPLSATPESSTTVAFAPPPVPLSCSVHSTGGSHSPLHERFPDFCFRWTGEPGDTSVAWLSANKALYFFQETPWNGIMYITEGLFGICSVVAHTPTIRPAAGSPSHQQRSCSGKV